MIIRLVDVRPRDAYEAGHIPGSAHLDPEGDLTGEVGDAGRGRHPLPDSQALAEAFGRSGINAETFVLGLDDGSGWAARLWWLLRHLGHEAAGTVDMRTYSGPLTTHESDTAAVVFEARVRADDLIDADEIRERLEDPSLVLFDARSAVRWRGDEEPLDPVAGRIPGARNSFFDSPLPEDATSSPEIAVYCGSGVTACVVLQKLVLAGRRDARLYAGSFSEWCRRDGYPIERGDS